MQTLKGMNVERGLELLEDFVMSVPTDNFDKRLKEKKTQAELALAHFGELFKEADEGSSCCHTGRPSQDRSGPPS